LTPPSQAMVFGSESKWNLKTLSVGAITAIMSVATSIAVGAEKEVPAWKKPAPGTPAFLGDDGGGVDTATVCGTADRYRDWLRSEHPSGCHTFQHDLPVIIEVVTHDPVLDQVGEAYLPIAKIQIPSRKFTGYVQLLGLHPVIPSGAMVHFKSENVGFSLFPEAKVHPGDDGGIDLGKQVSAKVISYDPTTVLAARPLRVVPGYGSSGVITSTGCARISAERGRALKASAATKTQQGKKAPLISMRYG
jgi:hypothetical protein